MGPMRDEQKHQKMRECTGGPLTLKGISTKRVKGKRPVVVAFPVAAPETEKEEREMPGTSAGRRHHERKDSIS